MAFRFPRNPRKSIYGKKYTKDCYLSFVFFATRSPSFMITNKQHLCDYPAVARLVARLVGNGGGIGIDGHGNIGGGGGGGSGKVGGQ